MATFRKGGKKEGAGHPVGRSILTYGPPFSGKTSSLQYDTSLRYLMIDFDRNTSVIEHLDNVDILGVDTIEEMDRIKECVKTGKPYTVDGQEIPMDYDVYVVDSFTSMEEKIKDWVVQVYAPDRKREIKGKFGAQTDWADLQDKEVRLVREWQELTRRPDKPINVLWLGHDMEVTGEDYNSRLQLRLQGKYAAPGIMSAVDACFYMYKMKNPSTNKMGFGIVTLDMNAIRAEARLSVAKREKLPQIVWFPKWGEIYRTLGATNLPEPKEEK